MTADERRDAIVAASVEEFATGGLVGASTEAIAKRAGVSQPYVFQLFGTKKGLFLAVVRSCFERTRLAFEGAAARLRPRRDAGLRQRPRGDRPLSTCASSTTGALLLVQLQAYAACADPDVRDVVREEFAALYRRVRELSGASGQEIHHFFAEGMLLNIAAAIEFGSHPTRTGSLENLEGGALTNPSRRNRPLSLVVGT